MFLVNTKICFGTRFRHLLSVMSLVCFIFVFSACEKQDVDPVVPPSSGSSKAEAVKVESVALQPVALKLNANDESELKSTILPSNATNKELLWSSDRPEIVSVDAHGHLKALKIGKAVITATSRDSGKSARCTVTVGQFV